MKLNHARIVLTGASGGIGQAIAKELVKRGAHLLLVDLDSEKLLTLQNTLKASNAQVYALSADLSSHDSYEQITNYAIQQMGHIDILINGAGIMSYTEFHQQDAAMVERAFKINVIAPMQLARLCLPDMLAKQQGQIVNIGSIFGSIGFAYFSSYSATKFALRGFTESLRRELADTGVQLTYVAPRAVKTPLNSPAVYTMAQKVNMNMDPPEWVADKIVKAIEANKKDVYLGFPESLFVRINAIFPRLVDFALRKQNRIMHECLDQQ
jgi:short-subunit dehydrogenase